MKIDIRLREQKKALRESVLEEKEKQILVKEITQLINKLKNLS